MRLAALRCVPLALLLVMACGDPPRRQRGAGDDEDDLGGGSCTVGEMFCDGPSREQVCSFEPTTLSVYLEPFDCAPGATCLPFQDGSGQGRCKADFCDVCSVGERRCSPDRRALLRCERLPPFYCAEFVEELLCSDHAMWCRLPETEATPIAPLGYCVNACGGRGTPLAHHECDPVANVPCAVYVCSSEGDLEPDHAACVAGGLECASDEQCASCNCVGGTCVGEVTARCPDALQCIGK